MRRSVPLRWLVLVTLLVPAAIVAQSFAASTPVITRAPGRQVVLRVGSVSSQVHIPRSRSARASIQTATINVNYIGAWDAQAEAAFQFAVNIWQTEISSSVPITIDAHWEALDPGVLGAAGPNNFINGFQHQPVADTFYPVALANELAGVDLIPDTADIDAQFSSAYTGWYFGTDGNTPSNKVDFVSTVLHELMHGLGFIGSMEVSGNKGSWGMSDAGGIRPFIYDRFAVNGAHQLLISAFPNNSAALAAQLTSDNVFFDGTLSTAVAGGTPPKLYAPSPWSEGSSYSHLDDATYPPGNPNTLMTFQINQGESVHDPGPIGLCMFADMGWVSMCPTGLMSTATAASTATANVPVATATATTPSEPERQINVYLPIVIAPGVTDAKLSQAVAVPSSSPTPTKTATATVTR